MPNAKEHAKTERAAKALSRLNDAYVTAITALAEVKPEDREMVAAEWFGDAFLGILLTDTDGVAAVNEERTKVGFEEEE